MVLLRWPVPPARHLGHFYPRDNRVAWPFLQDAFRRIVVDLFYYPAYPAVLSPLSAHRRLVDFLVQLPVSSVLSYLLQQKLSPRLS